MVVYIHSRTPTILSNSSSKLLYRRHVERVAFQPDDIQPCILQSPDDF